MKIRIVITLVWIISFLINIILIISYFDGIILLEEDNMLLYIKPIIWLYSPYVIGILSFWFLKPFPYNNIDENILFRYWLALGLTLFFNLIMIYFVVRHMFTSETIILDNIKNGVRLCAWLSIIVGPINTYFFGMKMR